MRVHSVLIPWAVEDETKRSFVGEGPARVPDLGALPEIQMRTLEPSDFDNVGAVLLGNYRATEKFALGERRIDRPELEVVLLARKLNCLAVVEDRKGVGLARSFGLTIATTAQVLVDLENLGALANAMHAAQEIRATRYNHADLVRLANGVRPPAIERPSRAS